LPKAKASTVPTLTLRREGTFAVRNIGEHWCGTSELQAMRYLVEARCGVKLDSRGFLFDQLSVDSYFQALHTVDRSCEAFVIKVARDLYKLILSEHRECQIKELSVTLSPAPFLASMTFHYGGE
jgi:hypothetical protein